MSENYTANQGDCLSSIAFGKGHFWETLWQDSGNQDLHEQRDDAHILMPGDVVSIPDIDPKRADKAIDQRHIFKRKGVPEYLRLQMLDAGTPRAGLDYQLKIDGGDAVPGTTDGNGIIQHVISPVAQVATLIISDVECYQIELGYLDPANTEPGARKRLVNLGLLRDAGSSQKSYESALADFKDRFQLPPGPVLLDEATQQRLKEVHGC